MPVPTLHQFDFSPIEWRLFMRYADTDTLLRLRAKLLERVEEVEDVIHDRRVQDDAHTVTSRCEGFEDVMDTLFPEWRTWPRERVRDYARRWGVLRLYDASPEAIRHAFAQVGGRR